MIYRSTQKSWTDYKLWSINWFKKKLFIWGPNDALKSLEQDPRNKTRWHLQDFSSKRRGYMVSTADLTSTEPRIPSSCEYITLPSPNGPPTCSCPDGFDTFTKTDGRITCQAPPYKLMFISINTTDMINFLTPTPSGGNTRQKLTSLATAPSGNPPSVDFHYKLENLFFFETDNSSNVRKLWKYSWSPKEYESKSRTKITDVGLKECCLKVHNWISSSGARQFFLI